MKHSTENIIECPRLIFQADGGTRDHVGCDTEAGQPVCSTLIPVVGRGASRLCANKLERVEAASDVIVCRRSQRAERVCGHRQVLCAADGLEAVDETRRVCPPKFDNLEAAAAA